jgi:hypothetical protein
LPRSTCGRSRQVVPGGSSAPVEFSTLLRRRQTSCSRHAP